MVRRYQGGLGVIDMVHATVRKIGEIWRGERIERMLGGQIGTKF